MTFGKTALWGVGGLWALACASARPALASAAAPVPLSPAAEASAASRPGAVTPAARAKGAPAAAPEDMPPQPFVAGTLHLLGSVAASPLRLGTDDLLWLVPAVGLSWITLHNDVPLYRTLSEGSARKPWLDHVLPTVSDLGLGLTEAGFVGLASAVGSRRLARTSAVAMQALIVSGVYDQVFKYAAWSNRPYENDNAHSFWDYSQKTMGMPSGHSASAFAVAEVYGAVYGREWTYPLAALVAYSRVYNQAHWPSDVVVGSILGIIVGAQARRAAALGGDPDLRFSVLNDGAGTPEVSASARF